MFGGPYYIWFMLAVFVAVVGGIFLVGGILWVGHWINNKETGATHGFLELPDELKPKPADPPPALPTPAAPPAPAPAPPNETPPPAKT